MLRTVVTLPVIRDRFVHETFQIVVRIEPVNTSTRVNETILGVCNPHTQISRRSPPVKPVRNQPGALFLDKTVERPRIYNTVRAVQVCSSVFEAHIVQNLGFSVEVVVILVGAS